jgi:DNA adenine methylase
MGAAPRIYERYVEPFAGSACLFFALRPKTAVLGDINRELLHAYEVIRQHPRIIYRMASSESRSQRRYYAIRKLVPEKLSDIERAARFVYLNRYCFNGVYRTNRAGQFNVPRGKDMGAIPSEKMFYRCSVALRDCELRSNDFEDCLKDLKCGDFVYLDPPYSNSQRKIYGEYGYGVFAPMDHDRLAKLLKRVDKAGASFLLSYCVDDTLIAMLSRRWNVQRVSVRRNVSGFAHTRRTAEELLVSNYETVHDLVGQ